MGEFGKKDPGNINELLAVLLMEFLIASAEADMFNGVEDGEQPTPEEIASFNADLTAIKSMHPGTDALIEDANDDVIWDADMDVSAASAVLNKIMSM